MLIKKVVVAFFLLLSQSSFAGISNCMIALENPGLSSYHEIVKEIESMGWVITHKFPPSHIICKADSGRLNELKDRYDIRTGLIKGPDFLFKDNLIEKSWQIFKSLSISDRAFEKDYAEIPICEVKKFDFSNYTMDEIKGIFRTDTQNRITNSYMIGEVAVAVILMESEGDEENWDSNEEAIALAETIEGLDWLSTKANENNVELSWTYEIHTAVPTGSEPIHSSPPTFDPVHLSWEFGWIDDALDYFGEQSEWNGIFGLANRLRSQYHCNWGMSLFIVKNDHTSTFEGGGSGYTVSYISAGDVYWPEIPAPFAVATYKSQGVSYFTNAVISHETCHVFGAMDEYESSHDCNFFFDCVKEGGYLRCENVNCAYCNQTYSCMMIDLAYALCPYTLCHIGWRHSDDDGVPDPIDPNSGLWGTIFPLDPGDLVRIYTEGTGQCVNVIAATEDNVAYQFGTGGIIWDGRNYANQECSSSLPYITTINNGSPFLIYLNQTDYSMTPILKDGVFIDDTVSWTIDTSWTYITGDIYEAYLDTNWYACLDWIYLGDGSICNWWEETTRDDADTFRIDTNIAESPFAKAIKNKYYTIGEQKYPLDPPKCPDCFIELRGWTPDGRNSNSLLINYRTYVCGDVDGNGTVNLLDIAFLMDYKYKGGPPPPDLEPCNVNCDEYVNMLDILALIDYKFKYGDEPCCGFCCSLR